MQKNKLIAGNWKMNGLAQDCVERIKALDAGIQDNSGFDMVICPPATLLAHALALTTNSSIVVGGQDCHAQDSGAFTGDIAASMLADLGCKYVIVGHSERRQYHAETSVQVAEKAKAAQAAGLIPIICVGETDAQRTAGVQNDVVAEQLAQSIPVGANADNAVIAYEPVWAIGTGKTASAQDVADMHAFIRAKVGQGMRILYGGSVKAANAREILHTPNVDGVLVGGASLKADEFLSIAKASS